MKKLKAKDVMTKKVKTVSPETSIKTLIEQLRETKFSGFPVVDDSGKVRGLISQNDVLRALAAGASGDFQAKKRKASVSLIEGGTTVSASAVLALKVSDLMTAKIVGCDADDSVSAVAKKMVSKRVHRVVVLSKGKIAGLISATDLVRQVSNG